MVLKRNFPKDSLMHCIISEIPYRQSLVILIDHLSFFAAGRHPGPKRG